MAAAKPEVLISRVLKQIDTRYERLDPGFGIARLDGLITDTRRRPTTAETKDGDRQTGSSFISRSTTDRHAVPTAILRFSGSPDSKDSLSTTPGVDRHPKRKMATAKPEVVLSHVLHQIDTRCERLDTGFRYRPTRRIHRRHPPTSIDSRNARWRPPNRK